MKQYILNNSGGDRPERPTEEPTVTIREIVVTPDTTIKK